MGTMAEGMASDFVVDSKGRCFLCLEQKVSSNSKSKQSQDPVSSLELYSLRCLFRYLEIEKGNEKGMTYSVDLLENVKRSSIRASLCGRCASLYGAFSELYQELELIEMKVGSYLKRIHGELLESVKSDMAKKFRKSSGVHFLEGHHYHGGMDIADALRMDVLRTCSFKLSNLSPRVHVQKLTPTKVDEKRPSFCNSNSRKAQSAVLDVSRLIKLEVPHDNVNSSLDLFSQPLDREPNAADALVNKNGDENKNEDKERPTKIVNTVRKRGRPPKVHPLLASTSVSKTAKILQKLEGKEVISSDAEPTRLSKTSQHDTLVKMKKDDIKKNEASAEQIQLQSLLQNSLWVEDKDNRNGSTTILDLSTKTSDQRKISTALDAEVRRKIYGEHLHEAANDEQAQLDVSENEEDCVPNEEVEGSEDNQELERNDQKHTLPNRSNNMKCPNCNKHFTKRALLHHQKNCKAKVEGEIGIEVIGEDSMLTYEHCDSPDLDWDRQSDDSYHPPASPLSTGGNESETELEPPLPKKSLAESSNRLKDMGDSTVEKSLVDEESTEPLQNATRADNNVRRQKKPCQRNGRRPGSGNTKKKPWSLNPETGHYICDLCSEEFPTNAKFYAHHAASHLGVKYPCNNCGKEFLTKAAYKLHVNGVHKGAAFKCEKCTAVFTQKGNLITHQRRVNCEEREPAANTRFEKDGKHYQEVLALRMHRKTNPETGKVQCTVCSKEFTTARSFRYHYKVVHSTGGHYKCELCGKKWAVKAKYIRHQETVHNQKLKLEAGSSTETAEAKDKQNGPEASNSVSGTTRARVRRRRRPQRTPISQQHGTINPETGRIQCNHCLKDFPRSMFAGHYKSSHLNYRFKCIPCGKSYRWQTTLRQHHENHHNHNGSKFTCEKCGASFALKSGLKHHFDQTACGDGELLAPKRICTECGKSFATKGGLKTHMRFVHWKALDHVCDVCGKGFVFRCDLRRHAKKFHHVDLDDGKPVGEGPTVNLVPDESGAFTLDEPAKVFIPEESLAHTVVVDKPTGDEPPQKPSYVEILPDVLPEGLPPMGAVVDPVTGKYKCNVCPIAFTHDSTYQIHYKSIHLKAKYKCALCDVQFAHLASINRHHVNVHLGIRFKCPVCMKLYSDKGGLKNHLKDTSCGVGKPPKQVTGEHVCHICGRSYGAESSLTTHIQFSHSESVGHMCDLCGKTYKGRPHLRNHKIRVHGMMPEDV